MDYISTRSDAKPLKFKDVLLGGLAPDGGLYVPTTYPQLDWRSLYGKSYQAVALAVLTQFIDDIPYADLKAIIDETYTAERFGSEEITPLLWLEQNRIGLLQLSNGPTLAFKDVALQLVARLMNYVLKERNGRCNLVAATSGDTGAAAGEAFTGCDRLNLLVLSPKGRMSEFQRQQMYTINQPNIFNLVVDAPFDGCQKLVKLVNKDVAFKAEYKIGGVNSINFARIAAQVVYYFYAYLAATKARPGTRVTFSIPSGNFGNAHAAYIAMQMGLPISIIVATNSNDVLDRFFTTNEYRINEGDAAITSSPSMDIRTASNLERLIFDMLGRNPTKLATFYENLDKRGTNSVSFREFAPINSFDSGKATDRQVLQTIRDIKHRYDVIIDPHTAVAAKVGLEQWDAGRGPLIIVETAQPAKFAETIKEALGVEIQPPAGYPALDKLLQFTHPLGNDAEELKQFIKDNCGAFVTV